MAGGARGRRCRGAVLLLLIASVLAPLVLYGRSPLSPLPDSTGMYGSPLGTYGGNAAKIRA